MTIIDITDNIVIIIMTSLLTCTYTASKFLDLYSDEKSVPDVLLSAWLADGESLAGMRLARAECKVETLRRE